MSNRGTARGIEKKIFSLMSLIVFKKIATNKLYLVKTIFNKIY